MSITKIKGTYFLETVHNRKPILEPLDTSDLKEAEDRARVILNELETSTPVTNEVFMGRLNQWLNEASINEDKLRAYLTRLAEDDGRPSDDDQDSSAYAPSILLFSLWHRVSYTISLKTHIDKLIQQINKAEIES